MGNVKADKKTPVAFIEYGQLMLTSNGKTVTLSPNGTEDKSYLWPSVSPDGNKGVSTTLPVKVHSLATSTALTQHIGYIPRRKMV